MEFVRYGENAFGSIAFRCFYAEVAELVDALDSGSSRRMPVGVRVPASAPFLVSVLVIAFSFAIFFFPDLVL